MKVAYKKPKNECRIISLFFKQMLNLKDIHYAKTLGDARFKLI